MGKSGQNAQRYGKPFTERKWQEQSLGGEKDNDTWGKFQVTSNKQLCLSNHKTQNQTHLGNRSLLQEYTQKQRNSNTFIPQWLLTTNNAMGTMLRSRDIMLATIAIMLEFMGFHSSERVTNLRVPRTVNSAVTEKGKV